MKKILFLIFLLTVSIAAFAVNYGLFIGVADYDNPSISKLKYTLNDVSIIEQTFLKYGLIDRINIVKLINPNRDEIEMNIAKLAKKLAASDTLYFFFSGHGIENEGKYFLLAKNSDPEMFEFSAVGEDKLQTLLKSKAARVVLMIDSCYSGAIGDTKGVKLNSDLFANNIKASISGAGKVVITSSSGKEESKEDNAAKLGLFTKNLVSEIERLEGAKNIEELMINVIMNVRKESYGSQTPQVIAV